MKLLYIINVEKRIGNFSLSSRLAAHSLGIEVHLAGYWSDYEDRGFLKREEEKYHVRIHQCPIFRKPYDVRNLLGYREVCEIIKSEKIDVIHCNTPIGGVIGRLAGKKCGVQKVIYQAHGFHFYKGAPMWNWLIYYPVEKWLARFTDVLITINKEDYRLASKKMHLRNNGKVVYIPGVGIDLSQYRPGNTEKETDDFVLISIGDLIERKNYPAAIHAVVKANEKSKRRIRYMICGEGRERNKLENQIKKLKADDKIHLLGYRSDVKELLCFADAFLLTSSQEGLARSAMEAMAAGLPLICSDIRGNIDLVENGVNGYLCKNGETEDYCEAILKLADSEEICRKMRHENLNRARQFAVENIQQAARDSYKNIMGGGV